MDKVRIIVATHKEYKMPSDKMYIPLHVGAEGKDIDLGYQKDNTGEHISHKNSSYCELTGMYWIWKNLDSEYKGLVHYRRHFSVTPQKDAAFSSILSYSDLLKLIPKYSVFVPKKRKYYIETLYSHYAHTHYVSHLEETRKIIFEMYPDYINSFDKVTNHTYGYMFNMVIMRSDLFDDYCEWLFTILLELEKRVDAQNSNLSAFQGRFYGRVSEIIFNVWLDKQISDDRIKPSEIKELPFIYMEKINRNRKAIAFLKAKFAHKKYDGSF